jgi:hypothetical protein
MKTKRQELIIQYLNTNGWDAHSLEEQPREIRDLKNQLITLYEKEANHIEDMYKQISNLKRPFLLDIFIKRINPKDFEYKTEDELIRLAINKVNTYFPQLIDT